MEQTQPPTLDTGKPITEAEDIKRWVAEQFNKHIAKCEEQHRKDYPSLDKVIQDYFRMKAEENRCQEPSNSSTDTPENSGSKEPK